MRLRFHQDVYKYLTWNSRTDEFERHQSVGPKVLQYYDQDLGEWKDVPLEITETGSWFDK